MHKKYIYECFKFGFLCISLLACQNENDALVYESKIEHEESDSATDSNVVLIHPESKEDNIVDSGSDVVDLKDSGIDSAIPQCGKDTFKCAVGNSCNSNEDCLSNVCSYTKLCLPIEEKSCAIHFGGDTCGKGEVGQADIKHESCCRSLLVPDFEDQNHVGKKVYLDKYEITAGRVRAFIADITKQMGSPNVKDWIAQNNPDVWNPSWSTYLPSSTDGDMITINLLLGDPRRNGNTQSQTVSLGLNRQFGGQVYAYVHGNNCGTFAGSYGFPTYWYPDAIQISNGEQPRAVTQEMLDVKSMNCITNSMLSAFCHWSGGQLATSEVMDFVTDTEKRSDAISGCGSQYDNHGGLLGNSYVGTIQSGGRCADVNQINVTFDGGGSLPVFGSPLNFNRYNYPIMNSTSDKAWQIAAPGRVTADVVKIVDEEGWMDLAGNLSEAVYDSTSGLFGLRFRGIGYGSSRSNLNVKLMSGETILRVRRPDVKSALVGGRCMRFR